MIPGRLGTSQTGPELDRACAGGYRGTRVRSTTRSPRGGTTPMRQIPRLIVVAGLIQLLGPAMAPPAHAQGHGDHGQTGAGAAPASRRVTMEALHAAGGVPPSWRFTVPPGDAVAGRQAFVDWKCYACHAIKGE